MKTPEASLFRCLSCHGSLAVTEVHSVDADDILEGALACAGCGLRYPVLRGIPRFVPAANYAASFGYQWRAFARTQVGGQQTQVSKVRFDATTKWPERLEGQVMLE